jgi:hypothetical protein
MSPLGSSDSSRTWREQRLPGLRFFVLNVGGHGYVYHDGDQGGFSSEMLIDPARHSAAFWW